MAGSKDFVCILGASGSGKSTYGQFVLDNLKIPVKVFNGDLERKILMQSHNSQTAEKLLSQKFNDLKNDAKSKKDSFAVESPMPMIDLIKEFKIEGYQIKAIFFGLESPDSCNIRIDNRVALGGLDIPPESVVNIYDMSFKMLRQEIEKRTFDNVYFFQDAKMIAEFSKDKNILKINDFNINWFNRMIKPFIELYIYNN